MDRDQIVALALSLDGLAAPDPRYVDLLMPAAIEPSANRAEARRETPLTLPGGRVVQPWSSCALLVRAMWRECGCAHPILLRPYRSGRAMADLVEIARDAGALRDPRDPGQPAAGDAVIVGDATHLHAYLVTAVRDHAPGYRVDSIDGGQRGGTAIAARTRSWPGWSREWVDVVDAGAGAPGLARPVYRWVDAGAL